MANLVSMSNRLLGSQDKEAARYIQGTAKGDSTNGWVDVDVGGETINVRCTGRVYSGDEVLLLVQNGKVYSVGSAGAGDKLQEAINKKAQKGDAGVGVDAPKCGVSYQASDDGVTVPTGEWSSSIPSVSAGKWLWTRTTVAYTDGNTTVSYSVSRNGEDGKSGASGTNGKMFYATCSTAKGTAAKVATLQSTDGWDGLYTGCTVSVKFTDGCEVSSGITLKVGGTTAYSVYTNGSNSMYCVAGTSVLFCLDTVTGTQGWYNCSNPVYASTVTVGNPSGYNCYIDSASFQVRKSTTVYSDFHSNGAEFGLQAPTTGNNGGYLAFGPASNQIKMAAIINQTLSDNSSKNIVNFSNAGGLRVNGNEIYRPMSLYSNSTGFTTSATLAYVNGDSMDVTNFYYIDVYFHMQEGSSTTAYDPQCVRFFNNKGNLTYKVLHCRHCWLIGTTLGVNEAQATLFISGSTARLNSQMSTTYQICITRIEGWVGSA